MWSVVLKELRQFSHGKTCYIAPGIVLFLGIMAMLTHTFPDAELTNNMRHLYTFLFFSSWLAGLFIFAQSSVQWQYERGDASLDTLLTTPLNIYQVCAGKFFSALIGALVPTAVLIPELIFIHAIHLNEYLLLTPLILGAFGSIILSSSALKKKRKSPHSLALFLIILSIGPLMGLGTYLTAQGQLTDFSGRILCGVSMVILGGVLMLAGAAAPNANRLLPLKLFLVFHAAIFPYVLFKLGNIAWDLSTFYAMELLIVAIIFAIMAAGERFVQSRRVKLNRQAYPVWRLPLTMFSTGAVNSLGWSVVAAVGAALLIPSAQAELQLPNLLNKMALGYFYLGLTWCIRRVWSYQGKRHDLNGVAVLFGLLILSCIIPGFAMTFWNNPPEFINYLSPIFLPLHFSHQNLYRGVLIGLALILMLPEIIQSCREFNKKD